LQAGFFFPGKIFKFPVFLATSLDEEIALSFLPAAAAESELTLWKISVPSDCKHAKFLKDSLVMHEKEFLFLPYSTFIVKSNRRETIQRSSSKENLHLRVICLEALADNVAPNAHNVPSAPRYWMMVHMCSALLWYYISMLSFQAVFSLSRENLEPTRIAAEDSA
jgi:hypothetical protein